MKTWLKIWQRMARLHFIFKQDDQNQACEKAWHFNIFLKKLLLFSYCVFKLVLMRFDLEGLLELQYKFGNLCWEILGCHSYKLQFAIRWTGGPKVHQSVYDATIFSLLQTAIFSWK